MKDLLNFEITSKSEGANVRHTMRHKIRDGLVVEFVTPVNTRAEHMPKFVKDTLKAWVYKYFKHTRKQLSKKQKAFYDALVWFHKEEGRTASYQEMCDLLGYKSKGTANAFVIRLIEAGWLWKDEEGRVIPVDVAAPEMID
jgi:hypothetical protein